MTNTIFRIYTKRIAYELRKQGFHLVGTDINKNFPQFLVYLFTDTPELRAALQQFNHT